MLLERLCDIFILHRGLDPNDEDSTVEEQVEKLLYIYSKDSGDANEKVQLVTTVEAMMELSKSFCGKPLETTVMNQKTWSFLECEPGIWLVLSVQNDYTLASNSSVDQLELTSSDGCLHFLRRLYALLFAFLGSLQDFLALEDGSGWDCLLRVITARKAVRKTTMKLNNAKNDMEKLLEDQKEGIQRDGMDELLRQSEVLTADLAEKLTVYEKELYDELYRPEYRLPLLKSKLQSFLVWYLSIEDVNSISSIVSVRNLANEKLRSRSNAGAIFRLVRNIQGLFSPQLLQLQCAITFDNRMLWSTLDASATQSLLDFQSRWDSSFLLGQTNIYLQKALNDFARSIFHESKCDYSSLDGAQKAKVVESVKELEERKRQRIGVMTARGQYISLDKYSVRLPSIQRISELRSASETNVPCHEAIALTSSEGNGFRSPLSGALSSDTVRSDIVAGGGRTVSFGGASNTSSHVRRKLAQGLAFFDSVDLGDGNNIVCNKLYARCASGGSLLQGRAFFLFFGRLVLTVVVPEAQLRALYANEFQALIWSYTTAQLSLPPAASKSSSGAPALVTPSVETLHTTGSAGVTPKDPDDIVSSTASMRASPVPPFQINEQETSHMQPPLPDPESQKGVNGSTNDLRALADASISALQVNSVRITRLVDKVECILKDDSVPRMAAFHAYDALGQLQLDITKLQLMYVAKKIKDRISPDLHILQPQLFGGLGVPLPTSSLGGNDKRTYSPMRSASFVSSPSSAGASSAGGASSQRRESFGARPANNTGNNNTGNGVSVDTNQLWQQHQPGTLCGLLQPRLRLQFGEAHRDVRAVCISPSYCALKMFNSEAPDNVLWHLLSTSSDALSSSNAALPTVSSLSGDTLLDRYFLGLSRHSDQASLLIHAVIGHFGFPTMRALHDIWAKVHAGNFNGQQYHKPNTGSDSYAQYRHDTATSLAVTRISTPQRGGIWVVGSRLLNGEVMVAVVTSCATFDEVMEAYDQLVHEATTI